MTWRYTIVDKAKDPTNGNIVVTVQFVDDTNPGEVYTQQTWAFDLTNARIDEWAWTYIRVLETREAAYQSIAVGMTTIPRAPHPARVALEQAQQAFATAQQSALVANLNNPEVTAAYEALLLAQVAARKSDGVVL